MEVKVKKVIIITVVILGLLFGFCIWYIRVPSGAMMFPGLLKTPLNNLIEYKWNAGETASDEIQAIVDYSDDNYILTFRGNGNLMNFKSTDDFNSWHSLENMTVGWIIKIDEVVIEDGIGSIGEYTFTNIKLNSIVVADSVVSIADNAFYNCIGSSTETVELSYKGSIEQWNNIVKGDNWCDEASRKHIKSIRCFDGEIAIQ